MKHSKIARFYLSILLSALCFSACQKDKCNASGDLPGCACYEIYAPVCGCDGITYPNDCHAECVGIDDYTQGGCP